MPLVFLFELSHQFGGPLDLVERLFPPPVSACTAGNQLAVSHVEVQVMVGHSGDPVGARGLAHGGRHGVIIPVAALIRAKNLGGPTPSSSAHVGLGDSHEGRKRTPATGNQQRAEREPVTMR
jgi:hypothetical protein